MAIRLFPPPARLLPLAELEPWREIPVSVVGDELNRSQILNSGLRPIGPHAALLGQAMTVECMVGDNSALHHSLEHLWPGAIVVADARGHTDTAVWGEIMHTCAKTQGAGGAIIDGAVRDSSAIASSGLPAWARGISPRGPHKGWGGSILGSIQCGGVAVHPGDLVLGDADGLIVIRLGQIDGLLDRCRKRMRQEESVLTRVRNGETTAKVLGMPPTEPAR
jgi:4-hydroxy-4-methyl-2-oxoglutarate aldolase